MSKTVKIISGWSKPGGSTCHFIWLTNKLNEEGYDCTFYGPHDWHKDKCQSGGVEGIRILPTDRVIAHYVPIRAVDVVANKRLIYSCHESPSLSNVADMSLNKVDVVHFVSERQRLLQGVEHPQVVIPPYVQKVNWSAPKNKKAAVIGSIDSNKHPAQAIALAREAGYERILLFGKLNDPNYFVKHILPLVVEGVVEIRQHEDDREKMYNEVDAVYHSSHSETFGLVEAECKLAGIPYGGVQFLPQILEEDEIVEKWKELLT